MIEINLEKHCEQDKDLGGSVAETCGKGEKAFRITTKGE